MTLDTRKLRHPLVCFFILSGLFIGGMVGCDHADEYSYSDSVPYDDDSFEEAAEGAVFTKADAAKDGDLALHDTSADDDDGQPGATKKNDNSGNDTSSTTKPAPSSPNLSDRLPIKKIPNSPKQEKLRGLSMSESFNKLNEFESYVLLNKGTERAFTGEYWDTKGKGTYICRRCNTPLYNSDSKFDSHCGWPSFDDEIKGAVLRQVDADGSRTEIICSNCGGHLGHVFLGEQFTAKNTRHCVNSVSMKFIAEGTELPAKIKPDAEVKASPPAKASGSKAGVDAAEETSKKDD